MKRCLVLITLFFILFSFQLAEGAQAKVKTSTKSKSKVAVKQTPQTLEAKFLYQKPRLIKLFANEGIEDPHSLFSDPRLQLYNFWSAAPNNPPIEPIMCSLSIERGKQKILENYDFLQEVENKYGVSKEILVSIFRSETNLGRNTGKYSVFNSLLTWAISGTRKWKWAQDELIVFVKICEELRLDPFEVPGSTHGAFGYMQFIPSSFVTYAIPWNGNEKPNLFVLEDAMASTASYLQRCGWDSRNQKSMRRAIYAYNASTPYVNLVFKYAKAIKVTKKEIDTFRQQLFDKAREEELQRTLENSNQIEQPQEEQQEQPIDDSNQIEQEQEEQQEQPIDDTNQAEQQDNIQSNLRREIFNEQQLEICERSEF